jgi:hypothetical protein
VLLTALILSSGFVLAANSDVRRWTHGKARHWFLHLLYRPDTPQDLGDGRLATEIILHSPMGLAKDADGNLYVTDRSRFFGGYLYRGQVVWKIDSEGRARIIGVPDTRAIAGGIPARSPTSARQKA